MSLHVCGLRTDAASDCLCGSTRGKGASWPQRDSKAATDISTSASVLCLIFTAQQQHVRLGLA
jgi:hypothetical protein